MEEGRPTGEEPALAVAEDQAAAEAALEASVPSTGGAPEPTDATGDPDAATQRLVVGPGSRDAVIRAGHVEFSQGGASRIDATTVTISQGGAGRVNARDVAVHQGGVGIVQTTNLRLEAEGNAFAVVARTADVSADARVVVLIAGRTSGTIQPMLDWRSALALVGGLVVVRRVLRILRRR